VDASALQNQSRSDKAYFLLVTVSSLWFKVSGVRSVVNPLETLI
jgi:hypothetical protein